ncbi:NAD-dependent epimerase/dehydratase family protein [Brevibacillus sp. SYP-B805]|uniref:NAD-dependent epimerase/dehydratase family protein n=1 Tax=Brevibacillus sp. SYP-B805 TaxID=1578199 RepID=UPI0013EDA659|nr:NAD-dependent epimerase/dehydratase family protein [Brevibacillus sp. SYP-B805]NGQ96161.1 NAD-dependent epimerase/dehydratase family protein [Brevibacillus sp. SYP-B805]
MKKALVLGASGGMGFALVHELAAREIETVAFARGREKLERLFGAMRGVSIRSGDLFVLDHLLSAGEGVDVIFHAANIPYPEWQEGLPRIMRNVLDAAKQLGAKVVVIDNIYAYGRSGGQKVTEQTPKRPHTKKGKIRLALEEMVAEAHQAGVPALVTHFPDFYGPNAENTLLHYTLKAMQAHKSARFVGDPAVEREYIFTPDGAKAAVELALRESAYGQHWNIPGPAVISGHALIDIMRQQTGYKGKVGTVGKGMISFIGLFQPMMREMVEMMYLLEEPVVLSGEKYEREIGPLPQTPYEEGIRKTLAFMKKGE